MRASLRQEEEAHRRRGWFRPEVGRLERRREAAGERGWKNDQRAVRLREEARPEWSGEVDRRRGKRKRKRRAPPPSRQDTAGFDLVPPSFCC